MPSVLAQESVTPYIAMLNGEPIRYAQSYVALRSGDGWWKKKPIQEYAGIDQSLANASQLGKGLGTKLVRALVELLFNDPEVTKIQTDPSPSNLRAIGCYEKAGFERQRYRNHPDGPAVHGSNTPGIRANTQCCLTLPSRDVQGLAPAALMSNVKHHEEAVIAEGIDSTIRGSWRHRAPSRTDVAGRTLYGSAVDGGLKPHSDIDLLVTVTVRLDETTWRALINDLLKLQLSSSEILRAG